MLQQAYIINKDLKKMTKGKMVAQATHGACYYMSEIMCCHLESSFFGDPTDEKDRMLERYQEWTKDKVMKKIVLKATEEEIRAMSYNLTVNKNIWCYQVHDLGLTQVPENSLTCLVVEPLPEEKHKELFGHLKLL
ncbi:hypothetical protein KAU33_16075 [Candidatus Dependentiae bacterium]|nr:hypothetical protein [Candidatus Dependentiae bacterium]